MHKKLYIILMTKTKEEADKFWFEEMSGKERKFVSNDISIGITTSLPTLQWCGYAK